MAVIGCHTLLPTSTLHPNPCFSSVWKSCQVRNKSVIYFWSYHHTLFLLASGNMDMSRKFKVMALTFSKPWWTSPFKTIILWPFRETMSRLPHHNVESVSDCWFRANGHVPAPDLDGIGVGTFFSLLFLVDTYSSIPHTLINWAQTSSPFHRLHTILVLSKIYYDCKTICFGAWMLYTTMSCIMLWIRFPSQLLRVHADSGIRTLVSPWDKFFPSSSLSLWTPIKKLLWPTFDCAVEVEPMTGDYLGFGSFSVTYLHSRPLPYPNVQDNYLLQGQSCSRPPNSSWKKKNVF